MLLGDSPFDHSTPSRPSTVLGENPFDCLLLSFALASPCDLLLTNTFVFYALQTNIAGSGSSMLLFHPAIQSFDAVWMAFCLSSACGNIASVILVPV